eukprot:6931101-Prymnesium_polylepis.1
MEGVEGVGAIGGSGNRRQAEAEDGRDRHRARRRPKAADAGRDAGAVHAVRQILGRMIRLDGIGADGVKKLTGKLEIAFRRLR